MPTYHLTMLAQQARYLMEKENKSESEAIKQAIEAAGISEEEAKEANLQQEVSKLMNRDTEQEKQEAEQQLKQQAEGSFTTDIIKDDTDASTDEKKTQE